MEFEVYLSESKKFVVCRPFVPVTMELARTMAAAIAKIAEETGVLDRLVDNRQVYSAMSVTDSYDIAYKGLEEMEIDRSTKVALLHNTSDTSHDFACLAARNAGFNVRSFADEAEAIEWLEE